MDQEMTMTGLPASMTRWSSVCEGDGVERPGSLYQQTYAGIAYGLSDGFYTGEEALAFLVQLDTIRLRETALRQRSERVGSRKSRDLELRLERLHAQMGEIRCERRRHSRLH